MNPECAALLALVGAPTAQGFRDAWTGRSHRAALSRVKPGDFGAYLRRNAPSGNATLHLFSLSDPPVPLGTFGVTSAPPDPRRQFTPSLPDVPCGPVAAVFLGERPLLLCAVVDAAPPRNVTLAAPEQTAPGRA